VNRQAIHVNDKSDFSGERTPLALSIGDSDNIDRYDVYRIHENLKYILFTELPYQEQLEHVIKVLDKLYKYNRIELETKAATDMWIDKITFQIQFYERMKSQLKSSDFLGTTTAIVKNL
jgi:uncharacterized protein